MVGALNTPTSVRVTAMTVDESLRSQKNKRAFPITGERTIIIIRVVLQGSSYSQPATAVQLTDMIFDGAESVDGFFRHISRDKIYFKRNRLGTSNNVDLYTVSIAGSTSCFFVPDEVHKVMLANLGIDMFDWQHHVFAMPTNFPGCGTGVGNIGCNYGGCNIWTPNLRGDVFTHELGHNFGLDHANSNYIIGTNPIPQWQEYVDFSSAMSLSLDKMRRSFNPVDLAELDLIPAAQIEALSHPVSTLSYRLRDLYSASGTNVIRVTDASGVTHHISYRAGQADSWDADLATNLWHPIYPGTFANKVFVHRVDLNAGEPSSFLETVLEVDNLERNTFTLPDNTWKIKFRTSSGFFANVDIGSPAEVDAGEISSGGSAVPLDCIVGQWTTCSAQCGPGLQTRTVVTPSANGGAACPALSQQCNQGPCPVDCVQSEWTACSASCDVGTQTRTTVSPAAYGGAVCGPLSQSCNNGPCPVDCLMGSWGLCSAQCGGGTQTRPILTPVFAGGTPCGPTQQSCNTAACGNVVPCVVGSWSACSASCGDGTQTRPILQQPEGSGTPCPALSRSCNNGACQGAVSCQVGSWSACSASCGAGTQTRPIITQPSNGGSACPATSQSCNNGPCAQPVNCQVGSWSSCSSVCGAGTQTRPIITQPSNGGSACPATSQSCNNGPCAQPVNCQVGSWSSCSSVCGAGTQTRPIVTQAANGGSACPATSQACNSGVCPTPVDCVLTAWSSCSVSCGSGIQIRLVITESLNGGTACGALTQTCNTGVICGSIPTTPAPNQVDPVTGVVVPGPYVPDVVYPFTKLVAPGRIQAEYFDVNGVFDDTVNNVGNAYRPQEPVDIEDTLDTGFGYNVGWMRAGEWIQYTVEVQEAGNYRVEFRIASANGGGQLLLLMDDYGQVGPINIVPTDNWQSFATVQPAQLFPVTAGMHVFKIFVFTPGCNLNYFDIIKVNPGDPIPTAGAGQEDPIPNGGISEVNFAQCGNGVCEAGEDCFSCSSDCDGDISIVAADRFCCSGNRAQGFLNGEGWPLGAGRCSPPPAGVLPSN